MIVVTICNHDSTYVVIMLYRTSVIAEVPELRTYRNYVTVSGQEYGYYLPLYLATYLITYNVRYYMFQDCLEEDRPQRVTELYWRRTMSSGNSRNNQLL